MDIQPPGEYLRPREIARRYRLADQKVYAAIQRGELQSVRRGARFLVHAEAAQRWFETNHK